MGKHIQIGALVEKEQGLSAYNDISSSKGVLYAFLETGRSNDLFSEKQFGEFGEAAILTMVVEAKEKSNGLELGTWVLRLRREWKKDTARHGFYGDAYGIEEIQNLSLHRLNRDYLLYNLFFIFQTSLGAAMKNPHARQDVFDLCERIEAAKEIQLIEFDNGDKR